MKTIEEKVEQSIYTKAIEEIDKGNITRISNKHELLIEDPCIFGQVVKIVNGAMYIAEVDYIYNSIDKTYTEELEDVYFVPKKYANPELSIGDEVDVELVGDHTGWLLYINDASDSRRCYKKHSVFIKR